MSVMNLTQMTFERWIEFVFNHPVSEPAWYWGEEWSKFWDEWSKEINAEKQIQYAISLFDKPEFLIERYSPEQIDQGLWMLLSGPQGFQLADLIWNNKLPWQFRERCIASMPNLFRQIFTIRPELSSCFMWWDELRDWDFRENRDPRIKDAIFQALVLILEIPTYECQMSALHGLAHLEHPGKKKLIEKFIRQNPKLDTKIKDYALVAVEGKAL